MKPAISLGVLTLLTLLMVTGCPTTTTQQTNPYLTLAEAMGITGPGTTNAQPGSGTGGAATITFRPGTMVIFRNNHPSADLSVSFAAWVYPSSIRSADQQDALLADNYVQLNHEERLGTAFTLPVGTFVYNGGGTAGALAIRLGKAQAAAAQGGGQTTTPTARALTIITPDVMLAFVQPPVSCESVAFMYTREGEPLTATPVDGATAPYGGATLTGGLKTLAQVDVYQCDPLRPGLFIKLGGGARQPDEYFEGEDVMFDFFDVPDANGKFAHVTIGTATTSGSP